MCHTTTQIATPGVSVTGLAHGICWRNMQACLIDPRCYLAQHCILRGHRVENSPLRINYDSRMAVIPATHSSQILRTSTTQANGRAEATQCLQFVTVSRRSIRERRTAHVWVTAKTTERRSKPTGHPGRSADCTQVDFWHHYTTSTPHPTVCMTSHVPPDQLVCHLTRKRKNVCDAAGQKALCELQPCYCPKNILEVILSKLLASIHWHSTFPHQVQRIPSPGLQVFDDQELQ